MSSVPCGYVLLGLLFGVFVVGIILAIGALGLAGINSGFLPFMVIGSILLIIACGLFLKILTDR
ncbi:hypothetical protein COV24_03040 [candidate division WWE3 bacterium CG10_big_fil_rev_8_21_14_0_10_32_10]|uniref:Major facilitator superfamily (MFS) profile domain-containing protein n=1 Tax=candidate division WWE3 bacterium CG10_big_fil_rev_8_21_14_0_10_32_10 TaxID=1975090 RepID=A0A2H0RC43_UNCKA|nr:MAG: hypothetical protein COV24_03040 [candidate division WWE3 bacterium CG10_big_fil_rev_8_21_14_0_10_32_10]